MPKKKALPKPALDPSFSAKKPISVWNRPLQLDSKGLFGALAKGAVHGFTGQWTELGGDAVDSLAALGLDSHDAPHLSWLLLRRALVSAMAELIRESLPDVGESKKDLSDLSRQLDEALEKEEVAIDRTLFDRPRDLPLLAAVQKPFAQWLEAYGLAAPAAAAVARRLPGYFVLALHAEWRSRPAVYETVREAVGRMTAEEYFARALEAPRDARKAELIDGALILFPFPLDIHERLHGFLFHLIRDYVDRSDLGEVRGSRSAAKVADDQIYQPDILRAYERTGVREVWLIDRPPDADRDPPAAWAAAPAGGAGGRGGSLDRASRLPATP